MRRLKKQLNTFLNRGHERTVLTRKNIVASFAIKGITILTTLVMVPLTIDYINPTRYGIWLTLTSMIAWMALFDIGFGSGLKNKFTEAKAKGELLLAKKYVSSTYAILCFMLAVVAILFLFLNAFVDWSKILNVSSSYAEELKCLVWICFISFGFSFILRLLTSILAADQRSAIASFIDMLGQLLSLAGIFILIKTTPASLIKLGIVIGFVPVLVYFIASIFLFNGRYKAFKPSIKFIDFPLAKQMMNLSLKFFIACCASFAVNQSMSWLILYMTNPVEVSNFNTAFKIFSVMINVAGIIIIPYWTSFTDAYTLKDFVWMKNSFRKLQKLFLICVAVELVILFSSGWIYHIWIQDKLEISFLMTFSVFLYSISLCWQTLCIYPLNGIGKIQLQFYSSIAEMILIFPIAIFMGKHWGTVGIILAPVVASIPRAIWAPIQLNKLINGTATGIWNK